MPSRFWRGRLALVPLLLLAAVLVACDASIQKSGSPDEVSVGQQITYTLSVRVRADAQFEGDLENLLEELEEICGDEVPAEACDLLSRTRVVDRLPDGTQFVSVNTSRGDCSHSNGRVVCDLGFMLDGDTATITIKVKANKAGTLCNAAGVEIPLEVHARDNLDVECTEVTSSSGAPPGTALADAAEIRGGADDVA
jgi:hypothetical protein